MTEKKRKRAGPNPFARALADARYHMRVIRSKKGKGSYQRRSKHRSGGVSIFVSA